MRIHRFSVPLALALMAGCAASSTKPVEMLDENTGMTLASLLEPIEFVPSAQSVARAQGARPSFAYLGPLELNRMGTIGYALWIHIAPGNDHQPVDIRSPGAVALFLDDGSLSLTPIETPHLGQAPYRAVASWGQTGYFELSADLLKRMASSQKLELDVRQTDDTTLSFFPSHDARKTLTEYVRGRGITAD